MGLRSLICLIIFFFSTLFTGFSLAEESGSSSQNIEAQSAPVPSTMIFTGAATYSIPVEVLPGRNNLAPNLTLSYNSFSGNGWLGLGWNLGLPAIQRAGKRGVDYSADDFLAGSDELVQRPDWGPGYYGLKIEKSFSRYYYDGTSWEVTAKNGMRFFYGLNQDAVMGKDSNNTFIWLLSRVEDTNGNFFTVTYVRDQGQLYMGSIDYTGHVSGLAPSNRVEFELEDRPDPLISYASGKKITTAKRLKAIKIYNQDNNLSRAFQLFYDQNAPLNLSRLIRVQRLGSDGISILPPVEIEWNNQNQVVFEDAVITTSPGSDKAGYLRFANLDGDGKDDMVTHDANGNVYTQLGLGDGTFESHQATSGPEGKGPGYLTLADINADGLTDLIKYDGSGTVYYAFSKGDSTFSDFTQHSGPGGNGQWKVKVVDINGDGAGDLIKSSGSTTIYVYMFDKNSNTFSDTYKKQDGPGGGLGKEFILDVNMDSYADLLKCDDSEKLYIFKSNKLDGFETDHTTFTAPGLKKGYVRFGDVNADASVDLIIHKDDGTVNVYPGNGLGSFDSTPVTHKGHGGDKANRVQIRDVNGDGFSDLVKENKEGNIFIYLSIPGNWAFEKDPTYSQAKPLSAMGEGIIFNDVTGDGRPDFVRQADNGDVHCFTAKGFGTPGLMTKARIENGASISMDYTLSTNFTHTLMPNKMFLVGVRTVEDGFGNLSAENFEYAQGLYDYGEREFRGFGFVKKTNPNGTVAKTWFHQDRYFKGASYKEELWDIGEKAKLALTTNTYKTAPIDSPNLDIVFARLVQNRTQKYDAQTVFTQKDIIYDDDTGNPVTATLSGTGAEDLITQMEYELYSGAKGRIWRKTQETLRGKDSGKVREQYFAYDPDTGNLITESAWLADGFNPEISYGYDIYGNQTSVTDALGFTSTLEYDAKTQTFPVRAFKPQTNGMVLGVETVYNPLYAKPDFITDENGNTTYYTYDVFGRETRIQAPDGGLIVQEYYDFLVPRKQVTKIKENKTADLETMAFTYVDGLGRPIQSVSQGQGQYIIVKKHYDNMGREYLSQGPFFSNTYDCPQPLPATYPYVKTYFDTLSRPMMVETVGDTQGVPIISSFIYSGFNMTAIDPDNGRKDEIKDYLGRVTQIIQYTDTETIHTRYQYNAAKDLLLVTNHNGDQTRITYDTLGRKTSMDDPDMGHWEYTYDANGNLLTQTDAKGQVIRFGYDNLGRILTKKCFADTTATEPLAPETITYAYDNSNIANGLGRLYTVTRGDTQTVYDTYDVMGRDKIISKMIKGQRYTTSKTYDLTGKVVKLTYPDLYEVYYDHYAGTGLLKETQGKAHGETQKNSLAYFDQYEPTGKMGQVYYGNDAFTSYFYNPGSTRLAAIQTIDSTGLYLQDLSYDYTLAGDIARIVDTGNNITREYTYDRLHRLTAEHIPNEGVPINGMDVLAYTHKNPEHINGVSAISRNGANAAYIYDENGNMTLSPDLADQDHTPRKITYNTDNMPIQIIKGDTVVDFVYDGHGTRVAKIVNSSNTTIYAGEHFEVKNGVTTKYIFAGNLRIAMIQNNETLFIHKDHLGSSTVITDATGTIKGNQQTSYMPFGMTRGNTNITETDYKFTGQEFDGETGLYNYNARLYDPVIGVFITADTIVPDPTNPQTMNRYSYCGNNPLIYVDPSGHFSWKKFIGELLFDPVTASANALADIGIDLTPSNTIQNIMTGINNGMQNSVSPANAIANGGGLGGLAWLIGGNPSYSHDDGWGVHAGGAYYCFFGSTDWQERGYNSGWSQTLGIGYKYGYFVAGYSGSYNFSRGGGVSHNLYAGIQGQGFAGGVTYNLNSKSFSGYGHVSIGEITGMKIKTSKNGDGRPMSITNSGEAITGYQDPKKYFNESNRFLQFLDKVALHPAAVVHDHWRTKTEALGNILSMVPSAFIGRSIAGQTYNKGYGYKW
ncbi:MAG: hypothetical protein GY710_01465 [Desulfobacteraceae bacterium]|nr:hypothetical protein [Desulfobacteraceae bacterium]